MRIFVTKEFARFARKEAIGEAALCATIARIDRGLIDADLGGASTSNESPAMAKVAQAAIGLSSRSNVKTVRFSYMDTPRTPRRT